ncbi:TPA: efflux RND transporter permease subunit [Enterobacter hormaechei]|uniref:Efflux pump membrane transporter n=1 Tax=Citrobacter freundii TaxID=546 RepID=J7FU58_CITFR|nr:MULTISPECIES: efflux RND transporter permease subunit [Enterobacteriaceae]EKS9206008.1 efflux RND transporter permease subunit [Enterobacter cloacae]HAT7708489.1 efflux RND transporter permease subunit [Enterobacter roggenkampii]HBL9021541.1 efflux RND transporter permease subunit [Enterobacter hormaechei]HBM2592656.1 efflux RND transporter permease subunit [Enterobacter hormaechei subsp. hoffmannii]AFP49027.1 AcrF [Citrobacter freundii]
MSRFFIDRPAFAWVVAIVIMLAGALAIRTLPVNQYPNIAPPAIQISGTYPGASAQTVQDTVIQVIEQQLNGLDNLRYISSAGNSDGSFTITVTFEQGTDPDIAQVQVQNKLSLATPLVPDEVQSQGIRVVKYQINFMLVASLISTDGSMNGFELGDYLVSNLQDPLSRTKGVGDFLVLGAQNAMRIWLDPAKLNSYNLTPLDVSGAIQAQNVQVSSGQLGGLPSPKDVQFYATVLGKTRFQTPEQFENILLKVNPDGSQVRLRDVAQVSLGSENFSISSKYGRDLPSAAIALRLATGGNALESLEAVRATLKDLEATFPKGVKVVYPYDTAPVVTESISGVVNTLIEAIGLVFLVMFLFLQNWRATLIPTMAVPVVLLGTFGVMAAFGFSINILTMFGLVLAIGLLVDDAIVVVENVERLMTEEGLSPKEATRKSMDQITGALIGIGLILSAVFVPMAFFGGSTGVIYRQFSITIVSAMTLSVLVALVFTPALCATMLKPGHHDPLAKKGFFGAFNRWFDRNTNRYQAGVSRLLNARKRGMFAFLVIVALLAVLFPQLPTSFLPEEDQGTMFIQVQMPPNSSAERTQKVLSEVSHYLLEEEADTVDQVVGVTGFNFAGQSQSSGMGFVMLKPWAERESSVFELAERAMARFSQIKEATVLAIVPPSVLELGNATGFNLFLENRGGLTHAELMQARDQFLGMAAQNPKLTMVRPNGMNDEQQFQVLIDDEKVQALGLSLSDVNNTMAAAWGSAYINDFIDKGRVKKVFIQGISESRISEEDFDKWYVRNNEGKMVSFASFATGKWTYGSPKLERYNGVSAVEILGAPAPGASSGDAMIEVQKIAAKLPPGVRVAWTGLSYEERLSGSQAPALYALSLLMVFLLLVALYESWSIPFAVMLVVPLGVLGTVGATYLRGLGNDVFFQVGLLTTIGLAAKNAILIVEFAKHLVERQGMPLVDAAVEAAKLRLRPIIMTSLAFTVGVLPLAISSGASSGSKHAIGTGVVGGMITATVLAIYFVPLFFVVVVKFFQRKKPSTAKAAVAKDAEQAQP